MAKKPRPPVEEIRRELLKVVLAAEEPLTAPAIAKLLPPTHKTSGKDLVPLIEECCVPDGAVHRVPATTPKGKPRYWHHDVVELGRRAVIKLLDAKGPQTAAAIKKAAKGLDDAEFQAVFQGLVAEKAVCLHPPVGKANKELFGSKPPSPEKYLGEIGKQLTRIVNQLTEAHVPRDELRRALVQLIEAAGISFSTSAISRGDRPTAAAPPLVDLIGLMMSIEPRAERGALVGSRDLRRAAQMDKLAFDRAVLELARQGRVSLHRHDYASSLSTAEQDELVADGDGKFYVGVALRRAEA